jgi:hypothetical protein
LSKHAITTLAVEERGAVLKVLELQRHAMLMYTSCDRFFDELSGIEIAQILRYAGRTIQLAQDLFGDAVEAAFLDKLEPARNNIPEHRDGRHINETSVKPAIVDWEKIGAHDAVSSVFEPYPDRTRLFCYTAECADLQSFEAGRAKLVVGRLRLTSEIAQESAHLSFGALHFGDQNANSGVQHFRDGEAYCTTVEEMIGAFAKVDFTGGIRLLDRHFGGST